MEDLSDAIKFVAKANGVNQIRLRSGVFKTEEAPIAHVVPYITLFLNATGRVMLAQEVVGCEIAHGATPPIFDSYTGILNASGFAAILSNSIETDREGTLDWRPVEDDSLTFQLQPNMNVLVNEMLLKSYETIVSGPIGSQLANDLSSTFAELRNKQEVTHEP